MCIWYKRPITDTFVENNIRLDINIEIAFLRAKPKYWVKSWKCFLILIFTCAQFTLSFLHNKRGGSGFHKWQFFSKIQSYLYHLAAECIYCDFILYDSGLFNYLANFPNTCWPSNIYEREDNSNWIYMLWCPYHKLHYAGCTMNKHRRMNQHFYLIQNQSMDEQLPAYHAIRQCKHPVAFDLPIYNYLFIPLIQTPGDSTDMHAWESTFLNNYTWQLNTPHVFQHLDKRTMKMYEVLSTFTNHHMEYQLG